MQKAPSTCQAFSGSHSPANGWLPIGREQLAPYGANAWCIIAREMTVIEVMKETDLKRYAQLCGRALARAHARSADAAVLAGYLGKSAAFEDALADFSVAYADQNEQDHAALVAAVRSGRIEAQTE